MTKPMSTKKIDPDEIEEVREFMEAEQMLRSFMEQNAGIFQRYEELAGQYNQRRQAADKIIRAKDVSCGPWIRYSQQVKIDWKALYDYLEGDKDKFMSIGGKIGRITQYTGDAKELEVRITAGEIPEDDTAHFRTISPRYKWPNAITMP